MPCKIHVADDNSDEKQDETFYKFIWKIWQVKIHAKFSSYTYLKDN